MKDESARREELIAGALTGDLTESERQEFTEAAAEDPSILTELDELRATSARLDAANITWSEETASAQLEKRILAATYEADPADPADPADHQDQDAKSASPSRC